jgi:hypothetical protein
MKKPQEALQPRQGWSTKLARPIVMRDGMKIVTLGDARDLILRKVPPSVHSPRRWQ